MYVLYLYKVLHFFKDTSMCEWWKYLTFSILSFSWTPQINLPYSSALSLPSSSQISTIISSQQSHTVITLHCAFSNCSHSDSSHIYEFCHYGFLLVAVKLNA